MNLRIAAGVLCLAVSLASCAADKGRLDLPSFRHLDREAVESVDMTFGRLLLGPASWFIDEDDPEGRDIKALLRGIKSVRIRNYSFKEDFVYSQSDLDKVRAQLATSGWSRVLQARERNGEDVDIYVAMDGEKTVGFALIASQPREFTILNIVGSIDLDAVQRLRKHFDDEHDHHEEQESRSESAAKKRERYIVASGD